MTDRTYWINSLKNIFAFSGLDYDAFVQEMAQEVYRRQLDPESEAFYVMVDTALRQQVRGMLLETHLVALYQDIRRQIPAHDPHRIINQLKDRLWYLRQRSFPGDKVTEVAREMTGIAEVIFVACASGTLTVWQKERAESALKYLERIAQ